MDNRSFAANVVHESKQSLWLLQLLSERLSGWEDEPVASTARMMQAEVRYLQGLLDRLRYRSEMGSWSLDVEVLDLKDVVACAYASFNVRDDGMHGWTLEADSVLVETDGEAVMQMVRILLDNATKYTPESGMITVSVKREENSAVVSVSDTGCGISEADMDRIWQRYGRASELEGCGIGLDLLQSLAVALGVSVKVDSVVGQGTCFRLSFSVAHG